MKEINVKQNFGRFQNQNFRKGGGQYNNNGYNNGSSGNVLPASRKRKPDYCWSFNKGLKCKFGKKCRYIERCSYCDSYAHGLNSCPKFGKRSDGKEPHNEGDVETSRKS